MKCGDLNLQRGTAAATELGGDRHLHQLQALCPNFDQLENIYCAMQLCGYLDGPVVQTCRLLSLDCPQRQPLFLQVVCEHESFWRCQLLPYRQRSVSHGSF